MAGADPSDECTMSDYPRDDDPNRGRATSSWTRRRFLSAAGQAAAGLAAAGLLGSPRRAHATIEPASLRESFAGSRGTTLWFDMEHGPFPASGSSYRDGTTIVFVPHHYRIPESGLVDMIVHFHGHNTTAQESMENHQLREQLYDSRQNAVLVMPQGPVNASDSSGGNLDREDGLLDFLTEVRRSLQISAVRSLLADAAIPSAARVGVVCLSAHSGGYRVAARCAELGGFDVTEIYLFDALYAEVETFRDWVLARRTVSHSRERHKLVSFYRDDRSVRRNNRELMREFDSAGIDYAHEERGTPITRREFTRARAVFIEESTGHSGVTHEHNNLRDCLYASCLRRRLDSDWFDQAGEARVVEARE